jgi:hypothetical protein
MPPSIPALTPHLTHFSILAPGITRLSLARQPDISGRDKIRSALRYAQRTLG